MYRVIAMAGLFVFSTYASAFPLLNVLTMERFLKDRPRVSSEDASVHCANLSGQWKGKCQDQKEQSFEITQDGCEYIGSKDGQLPVGGVLRFGLTLPQTAKAPQAIVEATLSSSWSSDGTALVFDLFSSGKELGTGKPHKSYEGRGAVKLVGNKLQVTYGELGKPETALCEFDKQ